MRKNRRLYATYTVTKKVYMGSIYKQLESCFIWTEGLLLLFDCFVKLLILRNWRNQYWSTWSRSGRTSQRQSTVPQHARQLCWDAQFEKHFTKKHKWVALIKIKWESCPSTLLLKKLSTMPWSMEEWKHNFTIPDFGTDRSTTGTHWIGGWVDSKGRLDRLDTAG